MNMHSNPQSASRDIPFAVTDPEKIPAQRYYDQSFFELENEKLWPHVWQMACRLEEIANVGDYVEYRILDKSVIVIRSKSGVKAFHNACRHRGVQLVTEAGNCKAKGIICPFHGWRWNLEGENTFVFGKQIFSDSVLDQTELDLVPCRSEVWGGQVFINFDDNAPDLKECMGPVLDRLNLKNPEHLKMEWWYATELPTNWKLAMEAFMEGYHVMRTHPQLHALMTYNPLGQDADSLPSKQYAPREAVHLMIEFMRRLSSGMAGMVHPDEVRIAESLHDMEIPDDAMGAVLAFYDKMKQEIYRQGTERGLAVAAPETYAQFEPLSTVEFLFPHYFLLPVFSAMSAYRIRPLTAETCLFEIWSLAMVPEDESREPIKAPTFLAHDSEEFPEIPRQDYSNLPRQQIGLHAKGFDFMRLSSQMEGMISNYQRLIDGYLANVEPSRLAAAGGAVNTGFDSPILDIWAFGAAAGG